MVSSDDTGLSLLDLSRRHRRSIISQLVDISSEYNQQKHVKFRSYISELQCLEPDNTQLRRKQIDAFSERRYVALSYTWDASDTERSEPGLYRVENWDDSSLQLSPVRKCVLDRAIRYMHHNDVPFLWIDRHCIRQEACGVSDCDRHTRCIEKRNAIHAMDLVYQLSVYPMALLGRPLKNGSELRLLARTLSGNLVEDPDGEFRLVTASAVRVAIEALSLLCEITKDKWWSRAWTFQENYRGGTQMQLLISHDPSLEPQKRQYRAFGEIPGELCIQSVAFSNQATRLCLALREVPGLPRQYVEQIKGVLQTAGRYTLMLHSSTSMTPTVIADIECRNLFNPWDRLAIVANCCQYPVRLDIGALSRQRQSPSLSVLAMCLVNGEILDNGSKNMASVAGLKMSKFLERLMFRGFHAPEDTTRRLTFNKGCRLADVELTAGGIATRGHLWKLGWVVDTAKFPRRLPWIDEPLGRLTLYQRKCLLQLVLHLDGLRLSPVS